MSNFLVHLSPSEESAYEAVRIILSFFPPGSSLLTRCLCPLKGHIIKNVYCRKAPLVPDNAVNLGLIKGNDTTAGERTPRLPATDPQINDKWKRTPSWRQHGLGIGENFKVLLAPAWREVLLPESWPYCSPPHSLDLGEKFFSSSFCTIIHQFQ